MADTDAKSTERPKLALGSDNWPSDVADRVVGVVGDIKDKTTDNVFLAVRALVYGLVAAVFGIAMLVMLVITAVRLADAYLPIGAGVGSATWSAHLFVGVLVSVLGLGAWMSRTGTMKPVYAALVLDAAIVIAVVFYGIISAVA